jgi:hypothetical protein
MQFIDVTRALRLAVDDDNTDDMSPFIPTANLYHVKNENIPEVTKRVGMAIIESKEHDVNMLRSAICSAERNHLRRRHKALVYNLRNMMLKHNFVNIPIEDKAEFDTDLLEVTLIREKIYGEPLKLVSDPRPDFMKQLNNVATPKNIKAALKASGKASSTEQVLGCASCGIVTGELKRCGRCKAVVYCGPECQRKHWSSHKSVCTGQ